MKFPRTNPIFLTTKGNAKLKLYIRTVHTSLFCALLAIAGVLTGCKPYITHGWVEHYTLEAENITSEKKTATLHELHTWLSKNGYTLLKNRDDIKEATTSWTSQEARFAEVFRKSLDPQQPKSMFVVTVQEDGHPPILLIRLTSQRWGDETEHKRQIPIVEEQKRLFYMAFDQLPWLQKSKPARTPVKEYSP